MTGAQVTSRRRTSGPPFGATIDPPSSACARALLVALALAPGSATAEAGRPLEEDEGLSEEQEWDLVLNPRVPDDGLAVLAFGGAGVTTAPSPGLSGGLRVQQWIDAWAFGGDLGLHAWYVVDGRRALGWGSETHTTTYHTGPYGLARVSRRLSAGPLVLSLGAGAERAHTGQSVTECTKSNFFAEATCEGSSTLSSEYWYGPVADLSLGASWRRHRFDLAVHVQARSDGVYVHADVAGGWVIRAPESRWR